MAQKLLKSKKRGLKGGTRTPARASLRDSPSARGIPVASANDGDSVIVVGNYKTGQLDWIKKSGVYNWPVREDDEFAPLAAYLPKELGTVPPPQLRVCEAVVQLDFYCSMFAPTEKSLPKDEKNVMSVFSIAMGLDNGMENGLEAA